jgi:hypothetical protein
MKNIFYKKNPKFELLALKIFYSKLSFIETRAKKKFAI